MVLGAILLLLDLPRTQGQRISSETVTSTSRSEGTFLWRDVTYRSVPIPIDWERGWVYELRIDRPPPSAKVFVDENGDFSFDRAFDLDSGVTPVFTARNSWTTPRIGVPLSYDGGMFVAYTATRPGEPLGLSGGIALVLIIAGIVAIISGRRSGTPSSKGGL